MLRLSPFFTLFLAALVLGFSACDDDDGVAPVPVLGTITDIAAESPDFTILTSALERTGLDEVLDRPTFRYTVLAPTDAAFNAAGIDLGSLSDEELTNILAYHVIQGTVLRDGDVADGRSEYGSNNLQGPGDNALPLTFDNDGGTIVVNEEATLAEGPIEAVNGVIYPIDVVLLPPTIVDRAVLNGNFTTLITALQQVGLDDVLSDTGSYTVFAPTDEAFAAAGINLDVISDEDLSALLLYHVLGTAVPAGDIPGGQSFQTTLSATGPDDAPLSLMLTNADSVLVNSSSEVVVPNVFANNGVIHAIDEVLTQQSIVDFAVMADATSELAGALTAANLVDDLMGNGPFTVFAPVDAAFTAAADTVATLSADQLEAVLLYHVASGNVRSDVLMDDMVINTLNSGQTVEVNIEDGEAPVLITFDETEVGFIMTDIQGTNGVIHLIDGVMLPDLDN